MGVNSLEITGHGLELGLGAAIVEYFFTPWTDPESTRVNEIHVALDFDLPSGPIIVFPKSRRLSKLTAFLTSDRSSSARVPRPYEYFFNHTVGSPGREVCIYDKISHVWDDDERTPHERPRGTKSFADCLRIEFRTKPKKAREVDGLIRRMRPFIEEWRVADLRHAPKLKLSPAMDRVLRLTRDHGFLPKQASKNDAFEESSGGFANYIIRRLSGFGMKLGAAEQLAREVQNEVMDALDRLAEVSHIDLLRCFDEAADQLQEELELIVGVGATADPRAA